SARSERGQSCFMPARVPQSIPEGTLLPHALFLNCVSGNVVWETWDNVREPSDSNRPPLRESSCLVPGQRPPRLRDWHLAPSLKRSRNGCVFSTTRCRKNRRLEKCERVLRTQPHLAKVEPSVPPWEKLWHSNTSSPVCK